MSVENKELTPEQNANEYKQREEERVDFVNALKNSDVIKSLDLAPGPVPDDDEAQSDESSETEEQSSDVQDENASENDASSDVSASEENNTESEETEDELVPKSKIQPRFDKLKSELEYWKNKALQETKQAEVKATDEITQKLEGMNESELETLKDQARDAWMDAKIKGDANLAQQYRDLEKKADRALATAPQRFAQKQQGYFNQTVNDIAATHSDLKETDIPEILKIAKDFYAENPELHKDVKGQGIALRAAVREFRAVSKLSLKAKESPKLKSQLNTLKKAVMLDSKSTKNAQPDTTAVGNLLRKSKHTGLTQRERTSLIVNDPRFGIDSILSSDMKG